MAKVRIENLYDSSDCETCGSSYADGFRVLVDGEEVICLEPVASCFGGNHFYHDDLLKGTPRPLRA